MEVTAEAVEAVEAEAAESEDENEEAAAAAPGPRFEDDPEAQIAMVQVKVTAHLPTVRTLRSQTDDGGGDLGQLTVPQLKQRCREAGLKLSGRKAQLVQRLLGTEADTASSVEEASTESHSAPGSSTAAASAEVHGATGLHPGASLPSATFSLVHADTSLLVVDKGAGK